MKKLNIRPTGPVRLTGTAVPMYAGSCVGVIVKVPIGN
jgi:hypothetical protein